MEVNIKQAHKNKNKNSQLCLMLRWCGFCGALIQHLCFSDSNVASGSRRACSVLVGCTSVQVAQGAPHTLHIAWLMGCVCSPFVLL